MKVLILLYTIAFAAGKRSRGDDDDGFEGNDPKDNYFRYMRAYNGEIDAGYSDASPNLPKPGGFKIYYPDSKHRDRREVDESDESDESIESTTVVNEENPLELEDLEIANFTESSDALEATNELVINDFIRFKRDAKDDAVQIEDDNNNRPKRQHERNEKMLMSTEGEFPEGNREPRGATKDQWIKQPYPVQTTNPHRNYDDNIQSVNEMTRAPRVHFVTQRRSESAPPLIYHSYDRESRSRDLNRQVSRDLDRDLNRDMDRGYYPNQPIHYNQPNYQYRPYYSRDEGDRRQDFDYSDRYHEEDRPVPQKQKRIIYFATLPDVVRTPNNDDQKDRYYRDRYDYRYIQSPPLSVSSSGQNYRYRNYNPYTKSRYDEASKSSYPTKVSTDVNVREIKKNPERRIYSETDKRYPYKVPNYHHGEYSPDKIV